MSPTHEQLTIGAALLNPNVIQLAKGRVSPEDFYDPRERKLWEAILQLHANDEPIDAPIAHSRAVALGANGLNAADLHIWIQSVGSGRSITHYADQVREKATRRNMNLAIQQFQQAINDPRVQVADATQKIMGDLETIRDHSISSELLAKSLGEILDIEETEADWIIPNLLEAGDRLILTGHEGLGKTLFLRQVGILAAAGINPMTLEFLDRPKQVLYIDVENSERQWRRETRGLAFQAGTKGLESPRENIHVYCGPRMDLTRDKDLGLIHKLMDQHKPEIVVIGPIYRLAPSVNSDEEAAPLIAALDTISDRGPALLMEAHAAKAQDASGRRNLSPRGSSQFMGWPEFGLGLSPAENGAVDLVRWRGDRDKSRDWPTQLWTSGPFPWNSDDTHPQLRNHYYMRDE